jgi:hypothetical protein
MHPKADKPEATRMTKREIVASGMRWGSCGHLVALVEERV